MVILTEVKNKIGNLKPRRFKKQNKYYAGNAVLQNKKKSKIIINITRVNAFVEGVWDSGATTGIDGDTKHRGP